MIRIMDSVHGTVALSGTEERLLDTPEMQRLRGIRQLAMAHLVYPGANHTRFEHSIGTLFLADRICREAGLGDDKAGVARLAALLHDIGHVAFSHESEFILKKWLGGHEKIGEMLIAKGEIADILSENHSPKKIARFSSSSLGGIITSDIGADRMDYLLRDSHYTGVAYGVIDSERICSSLKTTREGLVVGTGGLEAAENLLAARFTMFSTVYFHKTVRIASRMLQNALSLAIDEGALQPQDAVGMADYEMMAGLAASKSAGGMAARLKERKLYKKAASIRMADFAGLKMGMHKAEEEIGDACGCPILLDVPKISLESSIEIETEHGGRMPIARASELVLSLRKMQESRLDVLVMCDEEDVKKVGAAARRLFG